MSQHQAWVPLDECINSYIDESEQSNHKYFKLWHLAFRGMTELGLDAFYTSKSVKLPVLANLTVPIPHDCLKVGKVGVFNEQGCVIPLSNNNTLSTAYDLQPTRLSQTQDPTLVTIQNNNGVIWGYNYWNGYNLGTLYGVPSGAPFVGSYKIDNGNGVIVLNETFSYPYIVLEYVASPIEGGEYYIPIQFKEALIAYLSWKDIKSMPTSRKGSLGDKRDRKSDFYNERRLAIARYDPINLNDLYEWNLENIRLAIKS
jgi:hypothetical protein